MKIALVVLLDVTISSYINPNNRAMKIILDSICCGGFRFNMPSLIKVMLQLL